MCSGNVFQVYTYNARDERVIKGVSSIERLLEEEGSGEVSVISVRSYSIRGEVAQIRSNFEQVT